MTTAAEYAILARNSYSFTQNNRIALPGWQRVGDPIRDWGGFGATVYQKGDEIVISFRGTDATAAEGFDAFISDFLGGNISAALGAGGLTAQLYDALQLVSDVQAQYGASANISFRTGTARPTWSSSRWTSSHGWLRWCRNRGCT